MREYETTFIVQPEISDEGTQSILERMDGILDTGGAQRLMCADLGKRKLAYEISKFQKGHYYTLHYLDGGKVVPDLERALRIDESVLRFLTVQVEDEVTDLDARRLQASEIEAEQTKRAAEKAAREAEEAKARAEVERQTAEQAQAEAAARAAEEPKEAEAAASDEADAPAGEAAASDEAKVSADEAPKPEASGEGGAQSADGSKEDGSKEDDSKEDGSKEDGSKEDDSKEDDSKEDDSKGKKDGGES